MQPSSDARALETMLAETGRMRRLAAALLRGGGDAEPDDVVQEARVAALTHETPSGAGLGPWLRRVARHFALESLRRRGRRESRERVAARGEALPSVASEAQRLALHRAVVAAVEELPEPQRHVVVRRFFDGAKPGAIAAELGVPVATVKTRLQRAIAQLRERLRQQWGSEFGIGLLALARGEGALPAAAAATGAAVTAATGAILMSSKAKIALAAAALLVVGVTASQLAKSLRARDGSGRDDAVPRAALVDAGTRSTTTSAGAATASRVEEARTDEVPPAARPRRERLGPQRLASLPGRVVDEQGRPAAGIEVEIVRRLGDELPSPPMVDAPDLQRERHRVVAAKDGSFQFEDLVRGARFDVFARGDGSRRATARKVRVGQADPLLLELKPTGTIAGVVVDATDGRPVAGATVTVLSSFMRETGPARTAIADAEGRFVVQGLEGERTRLMASAPDGRISGYMSPPLAPDGRTEMKITVGGVGPIELVVQDAASEEPIEGAAIVLAIDEDVVIARTGADGRVQLRPSHALLPYTMSAIVFAPGYARAEVMLPATSEPPPTVVAKLRHGRVATGRIVTRVGEPIPGAALLAVATDADVRIRERLLASSDEDGAFRIEGLDPGARHVLLIRHDECERLRVPFPPAELGSMQIDLGEIRVGRGALVAGCVVDDSGAPVPGAHVELVGHAPSGPTNPPDSRELECDAAGAFEFAGVPAGRVWVRARADGFVRAGEEFVDVKDEEIVDVGDVVLPSALVLGGVVTDGQGRPAARANVTLSRAGPEAAELSARVSSAKTDDEGRFRFVGIEPGTYALRARPPRRGDGGPALGDGVLARVDAGTTDAVVMLSEMQLVTGRVVDAAGKPKGGISLTLVGDRSDRSSASRPDGTFEIVVPANVEFTLEARVPDPKQAGGVMNQAPDVVVEHVLGGAAPITVTLPSR